MSVSYVRYLINQGYIDNWLVAGPQIQHSGNFRYNTDELDKRKIAAKYYDEKLNIGTAPVERGPLDKGKLQIHDFEGDWNYFHCSEDHLIDLSISLGMQDYAIAWAYTQLYSTGEQDLDISVSTYGPVDIWINKKHVFHSDEFSDELHSHGLKIPLSKGSNKFFIRFTNVASPDCLLAVSVRTGNPISNIEVRIPTLIPAIERRNELEEAFQQVYLDRDVYTIGETITLIWPETLKKTAFADVRLQTVSGRIYGQAEDIGKPGQSLKLGVSASLISGKYHTYLMPRAWELYDSNIRITKKLDLWVTGRQKYSFSPYGTHIERQREALLAASTHDDDLFGQIALASLGKWSDVNEKTIRKSIEQLHLQQSDHAIQWIGLLGFLLRHQQETDFPVWITDELRHQVCDLPLGSLQLSQTLQASELLDDDIFQLSYLILAGQAFPTDTILSTGLTGAQTQKLAEINAVSWLRSRGSSGFDFWYSKGFLEKIIVVLSHLVDLAETEEIWELSSVLLDKVFFSIALNSYRGVFGVAQQKAEVLNIKAGLLEPTSGITRVLWGIGFYNDRLAGTVSIACTKNYELPPIIAEIAANTPDELLNKEQQSGSHGNANTIMYRTPDYMLASVQDFHPGQPGKSEHIWQATLGFKSIVFVNHPGCSTEYDGHTPNYWVGNSCLPRVAQYKNIIIALYQAPANSGLGFTHAYFPTIEFDEYLIKGNTIFARKGDGFIALMAMNGLEHVTTGRYAYREIRSPGNSNIWICQMGRAAVDGNFSQFIETNQSFVCDAGQLRVTFQNSRAEKISFGWDDPLYVDGVEQSITGFKQYENPYTIAELPSEHFEISNGNYLLRLNFGDTESNDTNVS